MNRLIRILSCAALAACVLAAPASAKWWIFGQSADDVIINHMYLNNMAFDEGGLQVGLLTDQLIGGMIIIRGKASAGKAKIGSVQVSVDGKNKWDKARLSNDGAFEYSFKPEVGKGYDIYVKVIDTRGKTNDLTQANKMVLVSREDRSVLARQALDGMLAAYMNKNIQQFMSFVSEDFTADKSLLERAVQRDFSAFDDIRITYTINNITRDANGYAVVTITFNRSVTSIRSGQTLTDTGITQFTFQMTDKGMKAYAMKTPLIFGVSDPTNVATGEVVTPQNSGGKIGIDAAGNVGTDGTSSGGTTGASMGSLSYVNTGAVIGWSYQSFTFSDGTVDTNAWSARPASGDFGLYGDNHHMLTGAGVTVVDMGVTSLTTISAAPSSGYVAANGSNMRAEAGHCYVFKMPGNAYAVMQVLSAGIPVTSFFYKYSASGPNF